MLEVYMELRNNRSGHINHQPTGYDTFVPNNLPPNPAIKFDDAMQELLSYVPKETGLL